MYTYAGVCIYECMHVCGCVHVPLYIAYMIYAYIVI